MQNQHVKRIDLAGWGGGMAAASGILIGIRSIREIQLMEAS